MSSRKKARGDTPMRPENEPQEMNLWIDTTEPLFATSKKGGNTKIIQLCHQVEEAISSAFICSTNPILRDLYVTSVEPIRGAALLRVLVTVEEQAYDHQQIKEALSRASGYLRGEVAYEIHRKRVPGLDFVVLPCLPSQVSHE